MRIHFRVASYLVAFSFCIAAAYADSTRIVTTTSTLEAITKQLVGDTAAVSSLTRGSQDPHYVQARPSYIAKLRRADLLISVGLGLEDAWLNRAVKGSRNSALQSGQPGRLVTGELITPIEIPAGKVTRAMGDVHPEGNPHFLLDPVRASSVAEAIVNRMTALRPKNAALYEANKKAFEVAMQTKLASWETRLATLDAKQVITHHKTLSYFFKRFGIEAVDSIEPKPGIPPSERHIQKLIQTIEQKNIRCILLESFFDTKPAESIRKKTGVNVMRVAPEVGALGKTKTYLELIDSLVDATLACLSSK